MKKKLDGFWNEVKGIANNIVSNAVWELLQKVIVPAATVWCLAYWQIPLFISFCISFVALAGLISLILKYRHIDFHYMFTKKPYTLNTREHIASTILP